MSHHEENYDTRRFDMESHFERILYSDAFKAAFETYFEKPFEYRRLRVWYGPAGHYWLKPGTVKKHITLALQYYPESAFQMPVLVVYEQDDLKSPGVFQPLK